MPFLPCPFLRTRTDSESWKEHELELKISVSEFRRVISGNFAFPDLLSFRSFCPNFSDNLMTPEASNLADTKMSPTATIQVYSVLERSPSLPLTSFLQHYSA